MEYIYLGIFIISILYIKVYLPMYAKQHGIHYIVFLIMTAISSLNYFFLYSATCSETALFAQKNIYAVMLFIPLVFLSILSELCKYRNRFLYEILAIIALVINVVIMTTARTGLFYKAFRYNPITHEIVKSYGIFHTIYYIYILIAFILTFFVIFINRKKKTIPRTSVALVVGMELILLISVFLGSIIKVDFNFGIVGQLIIDGMMIHLARRLPLYDVDSSVVERMERDHEVGIIAADKKYRLLGYNKTMADIFPDLAMASIDAPLPDSISFKATFAEMAASYDKNKRTVRREISVGERWYSLEMYSLVIHGKDNGYQVFVRDVTEKNGYIHQLEIYREELMQEVDEKITQIDIMKDASLLGIAELIESCDGSTGGHIKRTSAVVNILTNSLVKDHTFDVSPVFYAILEKVAPLHDVGKIAVDDAVLRKPGKFTPEEYEQMKKHTVYGGKIIERILDGIENKEWIELASNIATYHHEKWDGTGYPYRLAGEEIPLEARIMAVADVYDALVSKRCYKEGFDFDRAYNIIVDGMGTHFDPALRHCFCECVPALEAYYSSLESN